MHSTRASRMPKTRTLPLAQHTTHGLAAGTINGLSGSSLGRESDMFITFELENEPTKTEYHDMVTLAEVRNVDLSLTRRGSIRHYKVEGRLFRVLRFLYSLRVDTLPASL
jgi:hypothetical protein